MEALDTLGTSNFNFQATKPGRIKPTPRVNLFDASTSRAVPAQISASIVVRRSWSMACIVKPQAAAAFKLLDIPGRLYCNQAASELRAAV